MTAELRNCSTCSSSISAQSHFCWRCGADNFRNDKGRSSTYSIHPGEPVWSLNVVSSIMPHASGSSVQAFRFALLGALLGPLALVLLGYVTAALASAAFAIPVLYLFFFYETNEWKDRPTLVIALVVGVSAVIGAVTDTLLSRLFSDADGQLGGIGLSRFDPNIQHIVAATLFVLLAQSGPTLLVRRAQFDDLIDGLSFGIAAGSSYAAGQTLANSWTLISTMNQRFGDADTLRWATVVVNLGILKPLIFGSALGIVVAAFSGIGEGPGRPSKHHLVTSLTSVAVIAMWLVVSDLLANVVDGMLGVVSGLVWSSVVAGLLVIRVRIVLHNSVMEGAAQFLALGTQPKSANQGVGFCPECDSQLADGAVFCSTCGTSVRAHHSSARADIQRNFALDSDLSDSRKSSAIIQGASNSRLSSPLLVTFVIVAVFAGGLAFTAIADGINVNTSSSAAKDVAPTQEPTIDVDLPTIDPESGPAVQATPTTLAELPIPLDPVAQDDDKPVTTSQPAPSSIITEIAFTSELNVKSPTGSTIRLPLPEGWIDSGSGGANHRTQPKMNMRVIGRQVAHEVALFDYRDDELVGAYTQFSASKFKILNTASYSMIGYFTYSGVDVDNDGGRSVLGFTWIATTTTGVSWIVDWWTDATAVPTLIDLYFNIIKSYFEDYLVELP